MRPPKVLLAVSSGWSVRNFLRSGLIEHLQREAEVSVLLSVTDEEVARSLRDSGLNVHPLPNASPSRVLTALSSVLVYAHNRRLGLWHPAMWRWLRSLKPWWRRPFFEMLRTASWAMSWSPLFRWGRSVLRRMLRVLPGIEESRTLLDDIRPDVVVSGNLFSWSELSLGLAAHEMRIPTVASVLSWDNLSYKGFPRTRYARYLVWSELMGEELRRADPSVKPGEIRVVGSPQFDFHLDSDLDRGRRELFERIDSDPDRSLVTYYAGPPASLPDEPDLVEAMLRLLRDRARNPVPQLLVRTHPHDSTDRFHRLAEGNPDLRVVRPWDRGPGPVEWFAPTVEELAFLSNTVRYSDVNVTAFSSVALDAAVLDRPTICVAFTPRESTPASDYLRCAPEFGHCRSLVELGGVRVARSLPELADHLAGYLSDDDLDRRGRQRIVDTLCGPVDGNAASRTAEAILDVAMAGMSIPVGPEVTASGSGAPELAIMPDSRRSRSEGRG